MIRATPLALGAILALGMLAGCGAKDAPTEVAANTAAADETEALPSDGLAAPEGMPLDSESDNDGVGGNGDAVGSTRGDNMT